MACEKASNPNNPRSNEIEELKARIQALESAGVGARHAPDESPSAHRRRWFPWITLMVLINFLLWLSMVHTIFEADDYQTHKARYLTVNWLIVFIPLIVARAFLFSPYPSSLSNARTIFTNRVPAERNLTILNILNALACFTFVVVYLYYSAIPQYNKPVWSTGIDFSVSLPIPALALLIPNSPANDEHGPPLNIVPSTNGSLVNAFAVNGTSHQRYPDSAIAVRPFKDHWNAVVLNSSLLSSSDFSTTQDRVYISLNVNYNSSAIPNDFIESSSAISVNFEMFDPRLSLETVYDCEIATYPRMPAFAENTFSITTEHITDRYGLVIAPSATKKCGREYHTLLAQRDPAYSAYNWGLESSIPTVANVTESCDIAFNADNVCQMSVSISFGNHLIQSSTSRPGISHLDIWLNAGAITGTIQFFAWFLELLLT